MEKVFQRMLANNFSDLKGATVEASIPVPQALINEFIQASLRGNKNIASCLVSVHAQNRVSLAVKTMVLPWPLNLKLKLDKSVDIRPLPKEQRLSLSSPLFSNQIIGCG